MQSTEIEKIDLNFMLNGRIHDPLPQNIKEKTGELVLLGRFRVGFECTRVIVVID